MRTAGVVVAAAAALAPMTALAQAYPSKPIRMHVSFGAAGGGVVNARLIAEKAQEFLGVPLVIEANGAAGGAVSVMSTVRAEPDGYTLLYSTAQTLLIRPHLVKNNPFDTLNDLAPVMQVGEATQTLAVTQALPVKSFQELVEHAKRNPGKLAYASSGIGTTGHLAGSLITRLSGIELRHVPYKGGGQSLQDLVAGRVQLSFTTLSTFMPVIDQVRILAITQGAGSKQLANVPLLSDILPGYEVPPGWIGIFGPRKLPQPVVRRASDALIKAAHDPEVKRRVEEVGTEIHTRAPEEFAASIRRDAEVAGRLIRDAGITPR